MEAIPTAEEVFESLVRQLDHPRVRVMDPARGIDEAGLQWEPGAGGLLVWVVPDELAEAVCALAESVALVEEVVNAAVQEGVLIVARLEHVCVRRERLPPMPTLPWPVPSPCRPPPRRASVQNGRKRAASRRFPSSLTSDPNKTARTGGGAVERIAPMPPEPSTAWVAGALATELVVPAGVGPDDVTVEVDGVRVCRPEALVVFGRRPHLFLPGMAVLASGPSDLRFAGSLKEVLDGVGKWTPTAMDAQIVRAAVLFALTRRSWQPADRAFPIMLELGERLRVDFPPGGSELGARLAALASFSRDPLLDIEIRGGRRRLRDGVLTVKLPESLKQPYVPAEERTRQLLDVLGVRGPSSTEALIAALGWTRSTVRRVLAGAMSQGDVLADLPSPQSPGQRYRLAVES